MSPSLEAEQARIIRLMHFEGFHVFDIYTPPLMLRGKVWAHPAHIANLQNPNDGRESMSTIFWDPDGGPWF